MDPPPLAVYQSQQFVVKLNVLRDLPGTEVGDLVSDHPDNVVSHREGEKTGQTSQVKQLEYHNHFYLNDTSQSSIHIYFPLKTKIKNFILKNSSPSD